MTCDDTKEILRILKVNYRSSFKDWTKRDGEAFLELWSAIFKNTPFELVKTAVLSIIAESPDRWLPTAGMVNDRIKQLTIQDSEEEAIQAWNELRRFILNYHRDDYREHFAELAELTRKLVGISDLVLIGQSDSTSVSVERTRFLKQYKALAEKRNDTAITTGRLKSIIDPEKVKQLVVADEALIEGEKEK